MFSQDVTFLGYVRLEGVREHFGTSFWRLLGSLGQLFGGLGGSWGQAGISMDSGTLPGTLLGTVNQGVEG